MDGPRPPAGGKGHGRNPSATKATRPRSSTKGPLDADERPSHPPAAAPALALRPSAASGASPLSPPPQAHSLTPSRYASARRSSPSPSPSPSPGLASPPVPARPAAQGPQTPQMAQMAQMPHMSPPPPPTPPRAKKDFSYLLRPEIYHPLTLANVPAPFRAAAAAELEPDPATPLADLLASGRFRAAAAAAAQQLTASDTRPDPADHTRIFDLLYTRLACLMLLDMTALAAQEAKALEDLSNAYYVDAATGAHLVPWPLRVLQVRLQALGFGDPRRAVMSYYELAREARARVAAATARHDHSARECWKARLADLGLRVAGALIEMDDMAGAAAHLTSLSGVGSGGVGVADAGGASASTAAVAAARRIAMAKALLWLQLGDVDAARQTVADDLRIHADAAPDDLAPRVLAALCDMADGAYAAALDAWRPLHADAPADEMIGVNLAVCLLYVGRLAEGRAVLERLVDAGYASHTLLFNLATTYELCTDRAKAMKQHLAVRVADMEPSVHGWEKTNADFKL